MIDNISFVALVWPVTNHSHVVWCSEYYAIWARLTKTVQLAKYTSHALFSITVVPVMNGHPRDQAKVSVHCRWPLIRGNLTLKCVGRGIDNVAVQGRWPLTTGVA